MLARAEVAEVEADSAWAASQQEVLLNHGQGVALKQREMMLALKSFTDPRSLARKIITGVPTGSGFRAWQKLHEQYEIPFVAHAGASEV